MKGKRERLSAALTACGAVLKRQKKHLVYALPNGRSFTVSAMPSDNRADDNALTDLRHALGDGVSRPAVVNPPREKKAKPGVVREPRLTAMADALKVSGVQESVDLLKAKEREREQRWRIHELEKLLAAAHRRVAILETAWIVRLLLAIRVIPR